MQSDERLMKDSRILSSRACGRRLMPERCRSRKVQHVNQMALSLRSQIVVVSADRVQHHFQRIDAERRADGLHAFVS